MKPEHICFFLPSLGGGGAQRMVLNLADEMVARGHRVDLVLARAEGPYLNDVSNGVNLIDLEARRLRTSIWRLARYLRRERPDAVLATLTSASMVAVVARMISGTRPRLVLRQASAMRRSQRPWLVRLIYPFADAYVAISEDIKSDLTEVAGLQSSKVHIIPNPAYRPEVEDLATHDVRHPWFAESLPIVISVGRLIGAKGFDTLMRAFTDIRSHRPCRLVILGEGDLRTSLETLADDLGVREDVWMPGFVANPFKYVKRSSVFVLSSKFEPFGNVLVEAMAVGTPVVSTDCPGGPREILAKGKWGTLVPVGDHSAMASAVETAFETDECRRMDLVARARNFDSKVIAGLYATALNLRDRRVEEASI